MQTVVMTGGTSGFGRLALSRLQGRERHIVIGSRSAGPVSRLPLDLSDLASVRQFASRVLDETAGTPIDALILNAGLHSADPTARSSDGYDLSELARRDDLADSMWRDSEVLVGLADAPR